MTQGQPSKAEFRILVSEDQVRAAGDSAVRCISCIQACDAGHDPWRAWCLAHRFMVSNTFAKICSEYRHA